MNPQARRRGAHAVPEPIRQLLAGVAAACCAPAMAASVSDNIGVVPGSSIMLQEHLNAQRRRLEARDGAATRNGEGLERAIERDERGWAGNYESKVEIENFNAKNPLTNGVSAIPESRVKLVLGQGHLHYTGLPDIWMHYHIAREIKYSGSLGENRQDEANTIVAINPRWQRFFGSGLYGVEVGLTREDRYDLTHIKLRPFIEYWTSDRCKLYGSLAFSRYNLELGAGEPDFETIGLEPGFSCFLPNNSWIAGLNAKIQSGRNVNDDDNASFLNGDPVRPDGVTKKSLELRLSPFIHHRFPTMWG